VHLYSHNSRPSNATGPIKVVLNNCGPAECNTGAHNSRPSNATGPIKVVLNNCGPAEFNIGAHSSRPSNGPDSYLTLLRLVPWRLKDGSYVQLYYILLDLTVI
jgi:hypothetical protein